MTNSGLTRSVAVVAAILAAVGWLLITAPAQAGQTRTTGAMTGAPTVGTCTTLTPLQGGANTDTSTVVPCKTAHTARVGGVARQPKSMDWATATKREVFSVVANKCAPQIDQTLGRSAAARDTTAYDYFWFEPTKAQKTQGARWVSCSIVLVQGKKLVDLPTNHTPMVPRGKHSDDIAHCLTKTIFKTTCSSGHAWRTTGTFTLNVAQRPAVKSLNETAARRCLPHVDRHKKYYRFTYQDAITWAAGDHTVVCYSQTHQ
jgi:hypothetical protein